MKIDHVYIDKDGVIRACIVPLPEQPKYGFTRDYPTTLKNRELKNQYDQSMRSCKYSSIVFEDQHAINIMIPCEVWEIKTDSFYPLQCKLDIIQACAHDSCPVNACCEHCKEPVKVAQLITD